MGFVTFKEQINNAAHATAHYDVSSKDGEEWDALNYPWGIGKPDYDSDDDSAT